MSLRFGALLGAVALLVACQDEVPGPTVFDGVSQDSAPPEETRVSDAPAPPATPAKVAASSGEQRPDGDDEDPLVVAKRAQLEAARSGL